MWLHTCSTYVGERSRPPRAPTRAQQTHPGPPVPITHTPRQRGLGSAIRDTHVRPNGTESQLDNGRDAWAGH